MKILHRLFNRWSIIAVVIAIALIGIFKADAISLDSLSGLITALTGGISAIYFLLFKPKEAPAEPALRMRMRKESDEELARGFDRDTSRKR